MMCELYLGKAIIKKKSDCGTITYLRKQKKIIGLPVFSFVSGEDNPH